MITLRRLAALTLLASLTSGTALATERTIIVLDASGSMWGQIAGKSKIEIARDVLSEVVGGLAPAREVGLIAYGHRQKGQCSDIELIVPPKAEAGNEIIRAVGGIQPKGKTPLSQSVRTAAEALRFEEDKATVVLVTDGLETCNADPCALGRELEESGVDFTAHVVGFGLTNEEGREVACLAEETGGLYLSAADADELNGALGETVRAETPPLSKTSETPPLPDASLDAPDSVEIAQMVDIGWEGPADKYDRVELFDPNARAGEGKILRARQLRNGDMDARIVRLPVPAKPGTYEFRYFGSVSRRVLATRPVEVIEAEVALMAPESVPIAKMVTVEWIGPGARYDSVQIFDPNARGGEGKKIRERQLRNDEYDAQKVRLAAPGKPGSYELRYWNGQDRTVLATRQIEVTEALVSLSPEGDIVAGKAFVTDWVGPGARYDALELWDPSARGGEGKKLFEKRLRNDDFDNQRATLPAPAKGGTYELRYWNGENKIVLAAVPLEVGALAVSLDAPETLTAARAITVGWEGPGARYDAVQLWDPAAKGGEGRKLFEKRLRNDDFDNQKATLPGPVRVGSYELRYWNGDNKTVMATRPIEVTAIEIGLDAPDAVEVETNFAVAWKGPGARYDSVQIWDPSREKVVTDRRLRNGDYDNQKVSIRAPKQPGQYVLRYWNGDNKAVLSEQSLTVQ